MTKTTHNKLKYITSTLIILLSLTSCKTTGTLRHEKVAKVSEAQITLVNAVLHEREGATLQQAVDKNAALQKAEVHLRAALESLKRSNETIKEELRNDASGKR